MNAMTPIELMALQAWHSDFTRKLDRSEAAEAFVMASLDCAPEDRLPLIEMMQDHYSADNPIPSFGPVMDEASDWANWASRKELKAYALASFNRMSPADQRAFLDYIRRAAA